MVVVVATMKILFLLVSLVVVSTRSERPEETLLLGEFPADFIWAAATAAYQVEGGWNAGGTFGFRELKDEIRGCFYSNLNVEANTKCPRTTLGPLHHSIFAKGKWK